MRRNTVGGFALALCLALTAPVVAPGLAFSVQAKVDQSVVNSASDVLKDYQILIDPNEKYKTTLDAVVTDALSKIAEMNTEDGVDAYVAQTKSIMYSVVHPASSDDDDDDEDDEHDDPTINPDHLLVVGGNWTTPVANAGQTVSIVLPVVNMGKTNVTDAVVTPIISTDTTVWPFEITQSGYSQTIADLPGTNTGISDMDRRRELTWNLQTRTDVGNGYQKISFLVVYHDSDGAVQSTTLDSYIQTSGTAGVSADGNASVPRVIVTGFETSPEDVHAGESFLLTLHLKNTSTATSVSNMIVEITAAVEDDDTDTTYAAFLPTAGSSTIFVDKIGKNGTQDIQIELDAKTGLAQKPYAVDVSMNYEDERVNSYTSTTSVSIPVKQEARVEVSEPEVMPQSIEVGSESNIMFNIYNMGKTKLYNVQVKMESDTLSGGDAFVGNLDSGATGYVDVYATGQAATMGDGIVTILISYEDEAGEVTTIEKEIELYVSEPMYDDMMYDDMIYDDEMTGGGAGGKAKYVIAAIAVLAAAGGGAGAYVIKRKKKKAQKSLEDDLLDLDDDDTEL